MSHKSSRKSHVISIMPSFTFSSTPPPPPPPLPPPLRSLYTSTYTRVYPLHSHSIRHSLLSLDSLLRSGKHSLRDRDGWGQTPLMAACSRYGDAAVKVMEWMLLRGGAQPY
jgi:hypothetical protein